MDGFKNGAGKSVLLRVVEAVQKNKDYLGEVDGLIGDGDHGMNMNKGFTMFGQEIAGQDVSFTAGLDELGNLLFSKIGGSMGPIYGTVFMGMAEAAGDIETIDLAVLSRMLDAALTSLQDIVPAKKGDKTLIDTLQPAAEALKKSLAGGAAFSDALDVMKAAAQAGRDSTKDLVAKFGRSARLGERSRGTLDAGACSCCIILCAMADGIKELLAI